MSLYDIDFTLVEKDLKTKIPYAIVNKIKIWALRVKMDGMTKTRLIKGYHDEPLKGVRAGQRSIRLNKKYRLIYKEINEEIIIIKVLEVNAHEY